MKKVNTSFELRSEEVQQILARVPHWLIRWGSAVILSILVMLFIVCWLVSYPDVISSQIVITTNTPPEKLIAKTSGKIEAILIRDKANIRKTTPIAIIENSASYKDVFLLKSITDTISIRKSTFPFGKLSSSQLGDVENAYAIFQKEYTTNQLNKQLQPFKIEGAAQSYEARQLKERLALLQSQKSLNEGELELQKIDLDRYEVLYKKGIIATQEIERKRLEYLQAQKNYKNILSSFSSLKSSVNDLNRSSKTTEINEDKENITLERNVIQAFYALKKAIKDWELHYVLRSSIDGKVSYLQLWAENQSVTEGDNIFTIIPSIAKGYVGKVKAPALNSGKIKLGQTVNIHLASYPDREFGIIKGKLKAVSLTPDHDGNLLIDVVLPNGLQTSYKKKISFQQEMAGTADIITEDLNLLERILYQFRSVFKSNN